MTRTIRTIRTAQPIDLNDVIGTLKGHHPFVHDFVVLLCNRWCEAGRRHRDDLRALARHGLDCWFDIHDAAERGELDRRDVPSLVAVLAQELQLTLRGGTPQPARAELPPWLLATDASLTWWYEQVKHSFKLAFDHPELPIASLSAGRHRLADDLAWSDLPLEERRVAYAIDAARRVLEAWPLAAGWLDAQDRDDLGVCIAKAAEHLRSWAPFGWTPDRVLNELVADLVAFLKRYEDPEANVEAPGAGQPSSTPSRDAAPCVTVLTALMDALTRGSFQYPGELIGGSHVVVRPPDDAPSGVRRGRASIWRDVTSTPGEVELIVGGHSTKASVGWLQPLVPIGFVVLDDRDAYVAAA